MKKAFIMIAALCVIVPLTFAEETGDSGGFGFQAGISLGTDVLINSAGEPVTWNSLGFQPDVAVGPFGIGFDFTLRFKLMPDADTAIEIFPGDWIPDYDGSGKSILDLYLPKIMYFRYGLRGEPLYVKLGSIDDLTLGNGFIVGEYSNTKFLPAQRVFGLDVGLDGSLFDFPYVGIELLTGNLAKFDVFGGRLFVRPLVTTGLPILENLQVGGTIAMDRGVAGLASSVAFDPLTVMGADLFLPVLTGKAFPLAVFSELAFEPNQRTGFMVGAGGRLVSVITYGVQLRLLGAGFSPVYFDANYDLFRVEKAALMNTAPTGEGFAGWLAKAGASLLEDKLYFSVSVDGPFKAAPAIATASSAEYPHLRGVIGMAEGVLGGFFVTGSYDKYFLGKENGFFADLVDPSDAVITAAFNYKTGAAVFTLLYSLRYNPDSASGNGFDVTSSLQSSIKF
ncbi:MAG: hypothetical protein KKA67_14470 [Spirochaetes bacterium]|nr:hypothetical protein [Spirochaetota bacterium]MBU1081463.1 hypothetical protein [Spirochaetota bacterium]